MPIAPGTELGYAQSATQYTNPTTTPADIPGLTITFTAPDQPVEMRFDGDISHAVSGGIVVLYMVINGAIRARPNGCVPIAERWHTISRRLRITGLTPGTLYVAKMQIASIYGLGRVQGDGGNPMTISVVTL